MVYDHQNWRQNAACRNLSLEEIDRIFFLEKGGSTKRAKEICGSCKVRKQCLDFAIYYNESGIWGGMSPNERSGISDLLGLLSRAQIESHGVSASETRDRTQWGLATSQILESRLRYSDRKPAVVELEPRPQDRLPLMLVVEL